MSCDRIVVFLVFGRGEITPRDVRDRDVMAGVDVGAAGDRGAAASVWQRATWYFKVSPADKLLSRTEEQSVGAGGRSATSATATSGR